MYDDNISINSEGHLTIGGVDTINLVKEFGTPLYVMNEQKIIDNINIYKNSIDNYYDSNGLVCYASKAFSCKHIYKIMKEIDVGIDVVSMGELYTAMSVSFDPSKICYHGNNKSKEELEYALDCGVNRIVVDSFLELDMLDGIAGQKGVVAEILLRISPGIEAHTHDFIKTGQLDSKFGFSMELLDALKAVKLALTKKNIRLKGLHCHIGSQIFDIDPFVYSARIMIGFISTIKRELSIEIDELNIGGGFGIRYISLDNPMSYDDCMKNIFDTINDQCKQLSIKKPFVIVEPGRSIVGESGITLYTIGSIKRINGIRDYVCVDGGMCDNIRYALYGSKYEFVLANKANIKQNHKVTIAGKCCESGDLLAKDIMIGNFETGDILATLSTGAYNYSMSSNYNRILKPAVVMVKNKHSFVVVKREEIQDIIRNDV